LGSTLTILAGGVLSLGGVVVLLGHADGSVDVEGSLGNLAVLLLVGSSGGGLGNLSLVGHGVLVWDDDVLGTDVGVGSGGLGGELGVRSSSLGTAEGGLLVTKGVSLSVAGVAVLLARSDVLATASWGALERDGGGNSEEGSNSEFHLGRLN
jgi:hypothetical protein